MKTLEETIDKIIEIYNSSDYDEGVLGNTRWRVVGQQVDYEDSSLSGCLELADHANFDRWANSGTIIIHLTIIEFGDEDMREIIKRAFDIYG